MTRSLRGIGAGTGLSPGDIGQVAGAGGGVTELRLLRWGPVALEESEPSGPGEACEESSGLPVSWLRVIGTGDAGLLEELGGRLGMDALQLENALNVHDRPKSEVGDDFVFISMNVMEREDPGGRARHSHLGMLLRGRKVVTFEEREVALFDHVIGRMRKGSGRLRRLGADYLCFALADAVTDGYFAMLEQLAAEVEDLEDAVLSGRSGEVPGRIHSLKSELLTFHRTVRPLRELAGNLTRSGRDVFEEGTMPFIRDLQDHVEQVVETAEILREMLRGLLDTHLTSVSTRMNEVMKVLTIIATIFIPLTFIAGIYGMNFRHMPELEPEWGYPGALLLMLATGLSMVAWFRRRRWL